MCAERERGFTLLELVVTLVILGVAFAAIAGLVATLGGGSASPVLQTQALYIAEGYLEEAMLKEPFCAAPDMEMDELRRMMIDHHQRYIPVMEDDTLLGVVSFHDVAKGVLEEQSFENRMLKNYIRNWPAEQDTD